MQRRTFVGWMGAAGAAAVVGLPSLAASERRTETAATPHEATLTGLFESLVSRPLGFGFRVEAVAPLAERALAVTLRRGEERWTVRVCRRSATSSGLATTRLLDLRLLNGADGAHDTDEHVGVAVMTLAARAARLERADLAGYARAAHATLSTHDEHVSRCGGAFAGAMV